MCPLLPKGGHARVSPRRPPPGTLIMPSTCLFIPTCFPLLSPGLCLTSLPTSYCPHTCPPHPHVSFQPPRRPHYSKSLSCPLFTGPTPPSLTLSLVPSPPASRVTSLTHLWPPRVSPCPCPCPRSPKRTLPGQAGPCGSMRRRRRERVWERGGPCRTEPSRPAPGAEPKGLRQRPAAFHSGISIPGLQLLLTAPPAGEMPHGKNGPYYGLLIAHPSPGHPPGPRQQPPQRWGCHTGHLKSQEGEGIKSGGQEGNKDGVRATSGGTCSSPLR